MPNLTVDYIISLDGYGAAEGWPGFWGKEGPEYFGWLGEQGEQTALMGATTYRLMSGFAAESPEMLGALTAMPKVVFSSTLEKPLSWDNTELVTGDPVEAVRTMKQERTTPLYTLGSLTLARTLLAAGVVDRFRVVIFPVITGATGQERIFDGYPDIDLDLVRAGPSTVGSSCWSTFRRCSTGRREPERPVRGAAPLGSPPGMRRLPWALLPAGSTPAGSAASRGRFCSTASLDARTALRGGVPASSCC